MTDTQDTIDLGEGHTLRWLLSNPQWVSDADESLQNWHGGDNTLVGATVDHTDENGDPCTATVSFVPHSDGTPPAHTLDSADPVTISPGIECKQESVSMPGRPPKRVYHVKGSVTDGQWHDDA